jgi:type 1 fimbriae regulatory protein FimB
MATNKKPKKGESVNITRSPRKRKWVPRSYLHPGEIVRLLEASRKPDVSRKWRITGPNGKPGEIPGAAAVRDYALLLLMFKHGLRVSEACELTLDHIDLERRKLYVNRLKDGRSTEHPLGPFARIDTARIRKEPPLREYNELLPHDEIKALKNWEKIREKLDLKTDALFVSQWRRPLTRASVWNLIRAAANTAGITRVQVYPHILRHSCGYYLANKGTDTRLIQEYLGHYDIGVTVAYTAVNPTRFNGMF